MAAADAVVAPVALDVLVLGSGVAGLSAAGRCRAYFGEKDFQQLALVTRVVRDLALPTRVVGCPTVRDPDGLALSSRNARLDPDQRRAALALSRALRAGSGRLADGAGPAEVEAVVRQVVACEPQLDLDYAALVTTASCWKSFSPK